MIFLLLWLISLSMTVSGSIHIAANGSISCFWWLSSVPLSVCVCVCTYGYVHTHPPHLLYPFLCQWQLGCFHVLAVVNSAAVNIGVHVSFQTMFFSRYMPRNYLYIVCYISFISIKFVHTHTHLFSGKLVVKHLPVYYHHPHLFGPQWKFATQKNICNCVTYGVLPELSLL